MQNLSVKRMMALSVVGRAIREIEADPRRGLRRMVDLGRELSHSDTRRTLFGMAQDLLKNQNSPYYALLSRAVREINRQTLQKFCVTLGWDCWTAGVQTLRESGQNQPWAWRLTLDGSDDLRQLRVQWKNLRKKGVRMLIADVCNPAGLQQALVLTIGVSDGVFLFYLPPALLTPPTVSALADCPTLAVAVPDGQPGFDAACALLRQNGYLYGVAHRCTATETAEAALAWLSGLDERHGYFAILREQDGPPDLVPALERARVRQHFGLIPLAEQADFARIQQKILPQ